MCVSKGLTGFDCYNDSFKDARMLPVQLNVGDHICNFVPDINCLQPHEPALRKLRCILALGIKPLTR
jgi:hypothetical protein